MMKLTGIVKYFLSVSIITITFFNYQLCDYSWHRLEIGDDNIVGIGIWPAG